MTCLRGAISVARARKTAGPAEQLRAGRRPGRVETREDILDAAEELFSTHGFTATGIRQLAAKAKVNQALVFHYFGSKEGLYQAAFLRRGEELARERLARLDVLEARMASAPSLKELVEAYVVPVYELKSKGRSGLAFLRLQARLHAEPTELTRDLRAALYDAPMQRYVTALTRALPHLDAQTIYWRMAFFLGAYLYTVADLHRLDRLAQLDRKDLDPQVSLKKLVAFVCGGFSAPI
jgi:AcrR family transcriptional regulator